MRVGWFTGCISRADESRPFDFLATLLPSAPHMKIQRALISVSDKTGLVPFAKGLAELGVEIISTGGTARAIAEAGVKAVSLHI